MPKVTTKLQLTVPKAIADQYGIRPGDELNWVAAGDTIRVIPPGSVSRPKPSLSLAERLDLFDQATERQRSRAAALNEPGKVLRRAKRGWTREELYTRGSSS